MRSRIGARYVYPRPAMLGPHLVRLRPAGHARSRVERYALRVSEPGAIRWHHDAANNQVARVTWTGARLSELEVAVEMSLCLEPVNPLDFTLDLFAERTPFQGREGDPPRERRTRLRRGSSSQVGK